MRSRAELVNLAEQQLGYAERFDGGEGSAEAALTAIAAELAIARLDRDEAADR